jgi:GTP1/Obg family GTP-binding protein
MTVVPLASISHIATRLFNMSDVDIGRTASGGYGKDKQEQLFRDIKKLAKQATIAIDSKA